MRKTITLFALILALGACTIIVDETQEVDRNLQEQCMEPMFTSAFPIGEGGFSTLATMTPMEQGQSPTIWEKISEFPSSDGELIDIFFKFRFSRTLKLWFSCREMK